MRVVVDPVACDGYGMCALLAPEVIELDPWGYPVVAGGEVPEDQVRAVVRAVAGCPRRALYFAQE